VIAMDTILVVNAGSSSVKFQIFTVEGEGRLQRQIKGQMDGIGSRPRLRANGPTGDPLADRAYPIEAVADVPAAMAVAGAWLRDELKINPIAVGHRVVHGGPDHGRPVLIDHAVVTRLERYVSLAPLHQPHNLAPIRTLLNNFPTLPQVACFDTAFHRDQMRWRITTQFRTNSMPKASGATVSTGCPTSIFPGACRRSHRKLRADE
jgi:Acetate kinase